MVGVMPNRKTRRPPAVGQKMNVEPELDEERVDPLQVGPLAEGGSNDDSGGPEGDKGRGGTTDGDAGEEAFKRSNGNPLPDIVTVVCDGEHRGECDTGDGKGDGSSSDREHDSKGSTEDEAAGVAGA